MADLRYVCVIMAAVTFYAILQVSFVPEGQTREVFPRSHESVDDHDSRVTITERKVSNLRKTQTIKERVYRSTHANKRNVKFVETIAIAKESKQLLMSAGDEIAPAILARNQKEQLSSTGVKESNKIMGYNLDESDQLSLKTIPRVYLAEGPNNLNIFSSPENISDDEKKSNNSSYLGHSEISSKLPVSNNVAQNLPSKLIGDDKVEMNNDENVDTDGNNTIHETNDASALLKDNIYWSDDAESLLPVKFPKPSANEWRAEVKLRRIVMLLPGCGRDKNRLAILDNGEKLCCRYRQNFDQIQGEIISFYFSKLLGFDNLPFASLMEVNRHDEQWESVKENLTKAGWKDGKVIVVTKWIPDLEPAYMPLEFRSKNETLSPEKAKNLSSDLDTNLDYFTELMQWSDLILFDYLTANLDRIVNTWVNLQWNKFMFEEPVHNLEVSRSDRRLVFLDNESGLLHGYRMLSQYGYYHEQILKSVCVFSAHTRERLVALQNEGDVWSLLKSTIDLNEPLFEFLPSYPPKFREVLKERIARVVEHISQCQTKN